MKFGMDGCPACGATTLCDICNANMFDDMMIEVAQYEGKIFIGSGEDSTVEVWEIARISQSA